MLMMTRDYREIYDYPDAREIEQDRRDRLCNEFNEQVDEKVTPLIETALTELLNLVDEYNKLGAGLDYSDKKYELLKCF